jgi:hypothetical protein
VEKVILNVVVVWPDFVQESCPGRRQTWLIRTSASSSFGGGSAPARSGSVCALGGFNVSHLMGIKRRMIDIGKKIWVTKKAEFYADFKFVDAD